MIRLVMFGVALTFIVVGSAALEIANRIGEYEWPEW